MKLRTDRLVVWLGVLAAPASLGLQASRAAPVAPPAAPAGITLRLEQATLTEAAGALGRHFGTRIDPGPAIAADDRLNSERSTIVWQNASLDRALRELCARFRCACRGTEEGYVLQPVALAVPSPAVFSQGGVRLTVGGIARTERRQAGLGPGRAGAAPRARPAPPQGQLTLSLIVDLDEARTDWDVRLENVRARDDLGNATDVRLPWMALGTTFPGQRIGLSNVSLMRSDVRQLAGIQGDLVLSRPRAMTRLDLPYPRPGETQQRRLAEPGALAVSQARPAAPTPAMQFAKEHPDLPVGLLSHAAFEVERGPSMLMRVHRPTDPDNPDASEWFRAPRAIGRSGRSYPGRGGGGGARSVDGWTLCYSIVYFPEAAEPLEKLVWDLPGKALGGTTRIPFRLVNVPLPRLDALPVQQQWRLAPPEGPQVLPGAPPAPFFRRGGATLASEVRLLGRPAPRGVLRLGLSAREDQGWSAISWCEVGVDAGGRARLNGVTPGRYRLLRHYQLGTETGFLRGWEPTGNPAGRWLHSEVEVDVPPTGVVQPPPLELTAAPPPPSPAPRKPAADRQPGLPPGSRWAPVSVTSSHGRAVCWEGFTGIRVHERGSVSLSVQGTIPAAPGAPVGLPFMRQVSAIDDLGTVLVSEDEPPYFSGNGGATVHRLSRLSAAHPRAKELRWVEGEVISYRRRRKVRIEVPFPASGGSILIRETPNLLVTVADDAPPSTTPPASLKEPELVPAHPDERPSGPQVRFRVCYRDAVVDSTGMGPEQLVPIALGKSGAEYRPRGGGGMSTHVQGWVLHAHRAAYPDAKEPLEKLVWEFEVWEAPEPLGTFRLQNVPLAQPASTPALASTLEATGNAGGTLSVRLLSNRSEYPARIFFGLSNRMGSSWGPVRWTTVPVNAAFALQGLTRTGSRRWDPSGPPGRRE